MKNSDEEVRRVELKFLCHGDSTIRYMYLIKKKHRKNKGYTQDNDIGNTEFAFIFPMTYY